jgi:phosphatidylserine/phosphatidylglycerophosphate/cardiolipin synthase-like enzyme
MRRLSPSCALLIATLALAGCAASPGTPGAAAHLSATTVPSTPATSRAVVTSSVPPTAGIGPVIIEPDAGMTPIYNFMRAATSRLTMTMYELVDPTAEQILAVDAGRGVRVQVLLDSALEAGHNQPAEAYLASHGVAVAFAPSSRITHQKTICTDDAICLIMSLNLVAEDYSSTRDVAVEDSDPSDVSAIESTFAADFAGGTASATSDGDHLLWSPGSEPGIVGVINGARHSLEVENEEMDSTAVTDALADAARRGVNVEVCMTMDSDYTAALDQIADAGGHVRLYPDSDGALYIHEKLVLADADTMSANAVVGSINVSTSSMDDNRELDIVLTAEDAPAALSTLGAAFQSDFDGAPIM